VIHRDAKRARPRSEAILSLRTSCLSIEELEHRLESVPLRAPPIALERSDPSGRFEPEPCGCLGVLCQCDGRDCGGVCDLHCLIHYV
jgi:hypothetical protein